MKKHLSLIFILTVVINTVAFSSLFALNLGTNITIFDKNSLPVGNNPWHVGQGAALEDQEVEPGMEPGQFWDLEGFFVNGTQLSMVGGYDFINGRDTFTPGDIFIDIDGDAEYGTKLNDQCNKNRNVKDRFGYDYVLKMDYENYKYDVLDLNINKVVRTKTVYYKQNFGGNPWVHVNGGRRISSNNSFDYMTGLSDSDVGFLGGYHNLLTVDLGFLGTELPEFTAHYTMRCGNDNLMGHYTPVPEPGTFILLGCGLLGVFAFQRRKQRKNSE